MYQSCKCILYILEILKGNGARNKYDEKSCLLEILDKQTKKTEKRK